MEAVKVEKLTKYYGKNKGIADLDLTVNKGDFFGFIGPNGAGKSTTIRILLGLISPTRGNARIFGLDIVKDKQNILQRIGYLPSEASFYQNLKVKDILKMSASLRQKDCSDEARSLCERLELDMSRKIEELSFGNKKKVAIVSALQHCPELLILDEPTGGLDPLMQKEFFDILRERNDQGATIFLSSHILSEIQRNCKHAAIIGNGSLIACDSVETLSKTNARRITAQGHIEPEKLNGVKDIKISEYSTSFLYSGDINELLDFLSRWELTDLTITEPDLEEVFMHYYKKGGSKI